MTKREIRTIGDPVLRTRCEPITELDKGVHALVDDLLENVDADTRAGLSANQIGIGRRAFSWHIEGEIGYVLNPRIVALSAEVQEGGEGCLSVPDLWFPTRRANYARVVGEDVNGREVVVEGTGLMARCLQHETDHLEGLFYIDRLEGTVRREAMRALRGRI